ncbi:6-phosphofructo-2-kinase/fructose-2,6-bisphosphatase [Cimex lectularius]|uniref:6-phosphofructo-2-kinase domain-containing protein n=1 Tax=Cimex lectularius TaxID=79782 RepID=A0A8I6S1B2_CIMLE|nr:6-phosphofructo-2-kinase/fructose-2,6-bisphosphatase [Cimex lectularius]
MAPTSMCLNGKDVDKRPLKPATGQFVPLVVVLVGLPARGKTVLAHKLERYLNWIGHHAKVISLSTYRRKYFSKYDSNVIFDIENPDSSSLRKQYTHDAIQSTKDWLEVEGDIAILDGTHGSQDIRQLLRTLFVKQLGYKLLFIECEIDDNKLIEDNIKETIQICEDYSGMDYNDALKDLRTKIDIFSKYYTSISPKEEENCSYIKFHNAGENISVHRLDGPYQTKVLEFVSCFRPVKKTLFFTRHGESEFNLLGRIGGDTNLSSRGHTYANSLAEYFNKAEINNLRVWTSEKKRTKQTAEGIKAPVEHLLALNELDAGICEGMTYEEMQEKFPQEFAWRDQDKLRYRYPWGESYVDIMTRLEPVLLELEREDSVLVISHQAVLRCVLGYFLNTNPDRLPYLNVPLHKIIKLTSRGYECDIEHISLNVACVDTYRQQPTNCSADRSTDDVLITIPKHYDNLKPRPMEPTLVNSMN